MENNKMLLEDTLNKLLLKNQEVESFKNKKYEEIEKTKNVYIFSCDKQNIYKIGKSKEVEQRKKQLQTANVDTIIIHHTRPTSDDYLLELIVHRILDQYRCKSNGEHFTANLDYMKMVIDMAEIFFDTLKSTYEYITKEEFLHKINENILNQSIIDPYELNIDLETNNKFKKINKKSIIKQNILPITDSIIASNAVNNNTNLSTIETNINIPIISNNSVNNNTIETNIIPIIANNSINNNSNLSIIETDINIPIMAKFFKNYINISLSHDSNRESIILTSSKLFLLFNEFIKDNDFKIDYTTTKFGLEIKNYNCIEKNRTKHGFDFNIVFLTLKKYLIKKYNMNF